MFKKLCCLNLLLATLGCGKVPIAVHDTPGAVNSNANSDPVGELGLTEFLPADPNAKVTPAVQLLVQEHQQTATALLRALAANSNDNLVFSPYVTQVLLEMLYSGAQSTTQQEMATALAWQQTPSDLATAQRLLTQVLMNGLTASPNVVINSGTRLWLQNGVALQDDFNQILQQSFGARTGVVDFKTAPESARSAINTWVSGATQAKIPQLLGPGDITPNTRLVLAAALNLQARWTQPFMQDSAAAPFNAADGSTPSVSFLRAAQSYAYAETAAYQAVDLPYDRGNFAMLVLMPKTAALPQFLAALDGNALAAVHSALQTTAVDVSIPPFAYSTSQDLSSTLQTLGMHAAFDPNSADFRGITAQIPLFISKAIEQAQIAVDQNGTQASAAATSVVAQPTVAAANPATFTVNRPFVWIIHDTQAHEPLFMGQVLKP